MSVRAYIKLSIENEYLEIFPVNEWEFDKALYNGEMFSRYNWCEVELRNRPDLYRDTLSDAYRLYDLIKNKKYNEEIKIKVIWTDTVGIDTVEIEGIFWSFMCNFEDDDERKILKVTPITLDQYTYFLENWDTDIDILTGGNKNKIVNGNFGSWWNDHYPVGWTWFASNILLYRKFDGIIAKIEPSGLISNSVSPPPINVTIDESIQFSFDYEVVHFDEAELEAIPCKRAFMITLYATGGTYYLTEDGSWSMTETWIVFTANGKKSVRVDYFEKMLKYSIVSESIPASGELHVDFNCYDYGISLGRDTYLMLDNVTLYTNTTGFESITINIPTDGFQIDSSLYNSESPLLSRPTLDDYNDQQPIWADHPLYGYFNQDASFNMERGSDTVSGSTGLYDVAQNNLQLSSIITGFLTDVNSEHYLAELSQLTVYEVEQDPITSGEGLWGGILAWITTDYVRILATCEFTRQVAYTQDEPENTPVYPPGIGWYDTGLKDTVNGRKFVRTPFEGGTSWEFYGGNTGTNDINNTVGQLKYWGNPYIASLSSRRAYVDGSSKTYEKGIGLKALIKMMFNAIHPVYADKEVYSTFLWNDLENEMPTIFPVDNSKAGINYVTLDRNFLNNITCLHTKEVKTTIDDNSSDNELKISMKNMFDDLKSFTKIYDIGGLFWWIDVAYNLHIEHPLYLDIKGLSIDVSNYVPQPMRNYKQNESALYSNITFDQINSGYKDFHLNTMKFDVLTTRIGAEKKRENKTKILTTDVLYCLENASSISNGLILINHNGEGVAQYAETRISGKSELNGNLSLSTILNLFGTYEGVWVDGTINDVPVLFKRCLRMIEGEEVSIKGIVEGDFFTTPLDIGGLAKNVTHNFNDQTTTAKIIYRTEFYIMVQKSTDFVGAENIYLDLGFHL